MKTTFQIILGLDNGNQMNLTDDGFKDLRYDALTFDTEEEAQKAFDGVDSQSLIQDGFKGYHNITVWLGSYTLEADDDITYQVVAEKKITVDTTEAA